MADPSRAPALRPAHGDRPGRQPRLVRSAQRWVRNASSPKHVVCLEWRAWGGLLHAAARVQTPRPEPFNYDLVDVGREVLSQLTLPAAANFSAAIGWTERVIPSRSVARINATGGFYVKLLRDLDRLLSSDQAFLLGSW
eukprot:SAG11_NODE_6893_length_1230_cov_1.974359_2_plen_139_part_00